MWQVLQWTDDLPLFAGLTDDETPTQLPAEPIDKAIASDYHHTGLSLTSHPIALLRDMLSTRRVVTAQRLPSIAHGTSICVAGLVTVRQRPSTAKGIIFMTLEDETGVVNVLVRPDVYERNRKVARSAAALMVGGTLQNVDGVRHVLASRLADLADVMAKIRTTSRDSH